MALGLEKRESLVAMYMDLSKAFDCLDHSLLIKKSKQFGIEGQSARWLISCLSNRVQSVKFKGKTSGKECINIGVPQGSILGPTLFIMFINNLLSTFSRPGVNIIAYADNTNYIVNGTSVEALI